MDCNKDFDKYKKAPWSKSCDSYATVVKWMGEEHIWHDNRRLISVVIFQSSLVTNIGDSVGIYGSVWQTHFSAPWHISNGPCESGHLYVVHVFPRASLSNSRLRSKSKQSLRPFTIHCGRQISANNDIIHCRLNNTWMLSATATASVTDHAQWRWIVWLIEGSSDGTNQYLHFTQIIIVAVANSRLSCCVLLCSLVM